VNDKPICLDLYGRMGGAAKGYQRAGFYVISIDKDPQPGNPADEFIQDDALDVLRVLVQRGCLWAPGLGQFFRPVLVHTSPPCQAKNTATASNRARGIKDDHPDLVVPTRELLEKTGLPYVIEQPAASLKGTIRRDVTLCMDMFKGKLPPPWVQKHRSFELGNWDLGGFRPIHSKHKGYVRGHRHGVVRTGPGAPYVAGYGKGGGKATAAELRHAMGIDWMTGRSTEEENRFDLCEAIPPAYTEWLGRQFLERRGK
jgi:hypothetical protein